VKRIPLTKGFEAIVDDEWYSILSQWNWYYSNGYAMRDIGTRDNNETIFMHRYITMAASVYQVDHINRNRLDNRFENLRVITPEKNYYSRAKQSNNTSGYKGVAFDKSRNKYMATITKGRKQHNLGRFNTAKEAAIAYNAAAQQFFGEYAYLNDV